MSSEPADTTPPPPAPLVVVDARYCAPAATAFAVTKTIRGHDITVNDARGVPVMQVETSVSSFLHAKALLDAASRRPVLTLQDNSYMLGNRWDAYRGDSTGRRNHLFIADKISSALQTRTKVRVFLASNRSGEWIPDFVISGSYSYGPCIVSARGSGDDGYQIAQITRQPTAGVLFGSRNYTVRVNPGVDHAFILALTVILDGMHQYRRHRQNPSSCAIF